MSYVKGGTRFISQTDRDPEMWTYLMSQVAREPGMWTYFISQAASGQEMWTFFRKNLCFFQFVKSEQFFLIYSRVNFFIVSYF